MNEAECTIDPLLFHITDQKPENVEKIILKIMHLEDRPSAIICGSTFIAFKCMDTLVSMGFRIPDDISLVGMDNVQMASHHAIQLTTAGNIKFNLGEIAIENLLEMICRGKKSNQRRQILLKPELIICKTTKRYQ